MHNFIYPDIHRYFDLPKFHSQKQHLLKLYGKNALSNQKLRAVDKIPKERITVIVRETGVQRPTTGKVVGPAAGKSSWRF